MALPEWWRPHECGAAVTAPGSTSVKPALDKRFATCLDSRCKASPTEGDNMETEDAREAAQAFLAEFPAENFFTTEDLVTAAILWGERLGIQHTRKIAREVMADARARIES